MHTFNTSTGEAETGRSPGQPGLHSETLLQNKSRMYCNTQSTLNITVGVINFEHFGGCPPTAADPTFPAVNTYHSMLPLWRSKFNVRQPYTHRKLVTGTNRGFTWWKIKIHFPSIFRCVECQVSRRWTELSWSLPGVSPRTQNLVLK